MMKKILLILKWVWIVLILGVAIYSLFKSEVNILDTIKTIPVGTLLLSVFLIILAKIILVQISRYSIVSTAWKPRYPVLFNIYSLTQLGKYVPGGIWHYVGKFGIYKANGLTVKESTYSIVMENIWLVVSAFFSGAAVLFVSETELLQKVVPSVNPLFFRLGAVALLVLWMVTLYAVDRFLAPGVFSVRRMVTISILQFITWMLLGLSFYVLFPSGTTHVSWIIGGYCFSWVIGYLAVFAPGGIGVREAVLVAMLSYTPYSEQALIYAILHRVIWTLAEVLLGASGALYEGIRDRFKRTLPPSEPDNVVDEKTN